MTIATTGAGPSVGPFVSMTLAGPWLRCLPGVAYVLERGPRRLARTARAEEERT